MEAERTTLDRNEIFILSEIMKGRRSRDDIIECREEKADELGLNGTERKKYVKPISKRTMSTAVGNLKNKGFIENRSDGGGRADYHILEEEILSKLMLLVTRTKEGLDKRDDWDDFAGSAAAKGLIEQILPYMSQIEDESKIEILQMSSKYLREDLIRPLDENAEVLQKICNLLENEFFTYKWKQCPACGEEDCDHIKGFRLAKKSFLWDELGDLIDKESIKQMQKEAYGVE